MAAGVTAGNVVKLASSMTSAAEIAGQVANTASDIQSRVTEVADSAHKTFTKLNKEAASVSSEEVGDFQAALQETQGSGTGLREQFSELSKQWKEFEKQTQRAFKKKIGATEVQQCICQLQAMLLLATKCSESYEEFREKLQRAVQVGAQLVNRCKVAAGDARSQASNTRLLGFTASGGLAAAAAGFLTFATGGVAAVGTLVAGAAAAGAAAYTNDRAGKLDSLANEFDGLVENLKGSMANLTELGGDIAGLTIATKSMTDNMEVSLKFFQRQDELDKELRKKKKNKKCVIQ